MPQHVVLSNGYKLDIPDGLTNDQITERVNRMEAAINPQWKGLSDPLQSARAALNYPLGPVKRIASAAVDLNPYVGGYDLGASGLNALKRVAAGYYPPAGKLPDLPTVSGMAGSAIGAQPLAPGASPWRRYGEAAATGILSPRQAVGAGLGMAGSVAGGDIGSSIAERFGGPNWGELGRWFGSLGGATAPSVAARGLAAQAQRLASDRAPEIARQVAVINQSRPPNDPLNPTFGIYAGMRGRTLEKGLGSFPFTSGPIQSAQDAVIEGVRQARNQTAEAINRGPLPPTYDTGSIGRNMIDLARTRSAAIKADASQRFEDLNNQVGADTLVDAAPVARAIQTLMRQPNVSPDQINQLQTRLNYLNSMTYGQPFYNGPVFGHNIQPLGSTTLGQLSKFRSELGADLQNMPALDTVTQGRLRDAITQTIRPYYVRRGLGPQFDQANQNYAQNIGPGTVTEALDAVGGRPVMGKPGIYEGGMDEGAAYRFLAGNVNSPSALEPFVDPNSPYWRAAASQFVGSLGNTPQEGGFRADTYAKMARAITPEVLTQFTQGATGGPTNAADLFRASQSVGGETSVPVHRHGLSQSIGTLAGIEMAKNAVERWMGDMGVPTGAAAIGGGLGLYGLGKGIESPAITSAMAGRGGPATPLVNMLYTNAPTAATALSLNNLDYPPTPLPSYPAPTPSPADLRQGAQ